MPIPLTRTITLTSLVAFAACSSTALNRSSDHVGHEPAASATVQGVPLSVVYYGSSHGFATTSAADTP